MATASLKGETPENDERDGFVIARTRTSLLLFLLLSIGATSAQTLSFGLREPRLVSEWLYRSNICKVWMNALSKNGYLWGAIPKLQHVADLGATVVYLGPIEYLGVNLIRNSHLIDR
jgi:hypothetical protein